jgi:hypothetical protein
VFFPTEVPAVCCEGPALVPDFINTVTYFVDVRYANLRGDPRQGDIMPRRSPFSIKLTRRERAELVRRVGKYQCAYRDVIRAKIVLLASKGLANDVIGARLDTPRQIVSKWRRRFYTHRLSGLEDRPRTGRPVRFSPHCQGRDQSAGV